MLSFVPSALCGSPVVRWGKTGFPISPTMQWPRFFHVGLPAAKRLQFRLDWLTEQARYVRGEMTRRTMHASVDAPCHLSAKHGLLHTAG